MTAQQVTLRLTGGRSDSDPQGIYMVTLERSEAPQLYEALLTRGYQEVACGAEDCGCRSISISGTTWALRGEIAELMGIDRRRVGALLGWDDNRKLHIDIDVEEHLPDVHSVVIPTGAARREGREPSHDGESLTLYWRADGQWLLEDNAGLAASHNHSYVDASVDAEADEIALDEARAIQADIDAYVVMPDPARQAYRMERIDPVAIGHAACNTMIEWGWIRDGE